MASATDSGETTALEDFRQNRAKDALPASVEYLDYIAADRDFAAELAASGNPVWVVHAEKGGQKPHRRQERHPPSGSQCDLVTIPGSVFLLPDEAPQKTAAVIASALSQAT